MFPLIILFEMDRKSQFTKQLYVVSQDPVKYRGSKIGKRIAKPPVKIKAIANFETSISRLRGFTKFYGKMSYLLNGGRGLK